MLELWQFSQIEVKKNVFVVFAVCVLNTLTSETFFVIRYFLTLLFFL